jgi:hypothetical protein
MALQWPMLGLSRQCWIGGWVESSLRRAIEIITKKQGAAGITTAAPYVTG